MTIGRLGIRDFCSSFFSALWLYCLLCNYHAFIARGGWSDWFIVRGLTDFLSGCITLFLYVSKVVLCVDSYHKLPVSVGLTLGARLGS